MAVLPARVAVTLLQACEPRGESAWSPPSSGRSPPAWPSFSSPPSCCSRGS